MAAESPLFQTQHGSLGRLWRGLAWKARTLWQKRWIGLQDRFGWYRYADWIADWEPASGVYSPQAYQPLISLLVDGQGAGVEPLARSLRSVAAQTYPHWELCLPAALGGVGDLTAGWDESRLRLVGDSAGTPISFNALLGAAQGVYVMTLQAGDALSPRLLAEVVAVLNSADGGDIVYFDEDQLTPDGKRRSHPFFKPDWSPELLLSINYLTNAVFQRRMLLDAAASAAEDQGMAGLALDASLLAERVVRLPKVLYHKEARRGGALESNREADLRRVEAHLRKRGIAAPSATLSQEGHIRVSWPLRARLVSIIIPTRDHVDDLRACLESLRQHTAHPSYEILLVDSGSQLEATRRYYAELSQDQRVSIIPYSGSFNFSRALNLGAKAARGEVLVFLNNDSQIIEPGWLEELARWAELPPIGATGALLFHPNGAIQHAGIVIGMEGHASHVFGGLGPESFGPFGSPAWYRNYSAVTGACLAMRRQVFEQIGGFDEGYQLAFSDVDLCQRLIVAGYRVMLTPAARLVHREGSTRRGYIPTADMQRGYAQLAVIVRRGDPYYHPNLSYTVRQPTLRRLWEDAPLERLEAILAYSRLSAFRKPPA